MNGNQLLSRRRVLAVMQLLLFVLSVSTSARPCMHGGTAHRAHAAVTAHDMAHMSMPNAPPQTPRAPTESSHTDGCPWVVGCAGIAQLADDIAWRSVEHVLPSASPVGVMLREITTDRDIESPPPRA